MWKNAKYEKSEFRPDRSYLYCHKKRVKFYVSGVFLDSKKKETPDFWYLEVPSLPTSIEETENEEVDQFIHQCTRELGSEYHRVIIYPQQLEIAQKAQQAGFLEVRAELTCPSGHTNGGLITLEKWEEAVKYAMFCEKCCQEYVSDDLYDMRESGPRVLVLFIKEKDPEKWAELAQSGRLT